MVRSIFLICLGLCCGCQRVVAQEGTLSPELIHEIQQDFTMDTHARAMQNALTSTSIKALSENRQVLAGHNTTFSHKVNTKGISNQKQSGRCWMFAGFNTLRPVIMDRLDLDGFEFSHVYLQFWDKFEKSNTFLEYMIEYRDLDPLDREMTFLMETPCPDGGYWENFADLVQKYGVIPEEVMAETASSEGTVLMNKNLCRLLRKHAVTMRDIYKSTKSVQKMRAAKKEALSEVYKVLVLNLGQPPQEFTWRHSIKPDDDDDADDEADDEADDDDGDDPEDEDKDDVVVPLSEPKTYTPQSFYAECVGVDLNDYVNLADDPIAPKGSHIAIEFTKNFYDGQSAHYANVDRDTLKQIAIAMIKDDHAVYFAADVSPNQDNKKGIMEANLYDFNTVYGLDLNLDKQHRLLLRDSTVNHGMAFIGVDLIDDKPVKWLVENSWGTDRGDSGLWTMYDNWFDEYVFNLIVPKQYLPDEVKAIFDKPAEVKPVWYPMW